MTRVPLVWAIIGAGFIGTSTVTAQDNGVRVELFAIAQFPLLREENFVRYPSGPSEYKRLTSWALDKWRDRSPEHFDLVVFIENRASLPVSSIELQLTRDRKIGDFFDYDQLHLDPPDPRESAQWEGPIRIETKTLDSINGNTGTFVWFGPYAADPLWQDLMPQRRWPWEVRYQITIQCSHCTAETASASFTMSHPN